MATTTVVVPTAVTEGARALYDITEDELKAMRRFLPEMVTELYDCAY